MTLTDTGPLVALLNRNDPYHPVARDAAERLPAVPLLSTWPCVTEAMYLLGRAAGSATPQASCACMAALRPMHSRASKLIKSVMSVSSFQAGQGRCRVQADSRPDSGVDRIHRLTGKTPGCGGATAHAARRNQEVGAEAPVRCRSSTPPADASGR